MHVVYMHIPFLAIRFIDDLLQTANYNDIQILAITIKVHNVVKENVTHHYSFQIRLCFKIYGLWGIIKYFKLSFIPQP